MPSRLPRPSLEAAPTPDHCARSSLRGLQRRCDSNGNVSARSVSAHSVTGDDQRSFCSALTSEFHFDNDDSSRQSSAQRARTASLQLSSPPKSTSSMGVLELSRPSSAGSLPAANALDEYEERLRFVDMPPACGLDDVSLAVSIGRTQETPEDPLLCTRDDQSLLLGNGEVTAAELKKKLRKAQEAGDIDAPSARELYRILCKATNKQNPVRALQWALRCIELEKPWAAHLDAIAFTFLRLKHDGDGDNCLRFCQERKRNHQLDQIVSALRKRCCQSDPLRPDFSPPPTESSARRLGDGSVTAGELAEEIVEAQWRLDLSVQDAEVLYHRLANSSRSAKNPVRALRYAIGCVELDTRWHSDLCAVATCLLWLESDEAGTACLNACKSWQAKGEWEGFSARLKWVVGTRGNAGTIRKRAAKPRKQPRAEPDPG